MTCRDEGVRVCMHARETDRQTDDWDGTEATTFQWALGTSSAESKIPTSYPRTGMVWPRKDKDKNLFMGVTLVPKAPSE